MYFWKEWEELDIFLESGLYLLSQKCLFTRPSSAKYFSNHLFYLNTINALSLRKWTTQVIGYLMFNIMFLKIIVKLYVFNIIRSKETLSAT